MTYIPPNRTEIEFVPIQGSYTPPLRTEIEFTPGSEGPNDVYLNCLDFPFELTNNFSSSFMVEVQVPLPPLQGFAQGNASLLWYYPVLPLTSSGNLFISGLLIGLKIAPFVGTGQITSVIQQRVKLQPLSSGVSRLAIQSIAVAPEGTTVVSPWPMESLSVLEKPYLAHTLVVPPFILSNSFNVPLITAGTTSVLDMKPFELVNSLRVNISNQVKINPFIESSQLSVDFIKVMPLGDQYLGTPPFSGVNILQNPIIQSGFLIPPFELNNNLEVDNIFLGINLEVEPFILTNSFTSGASLAVSCTPMVINSRLASEVNVNLWVPPFIVTSSIGASIYNGKFIVCDPFQSTYKLNVVMGFSIDLLPFPFIQNSNLAIPSANLFVQLNPLTGQSTLSISGINIFTIDLAGVFYFFTLTGSEDSLSDIRIPISSFQARLRNGEPTYLQVVIPGVMWATEISLRSNGVLQVSMGYKLDGEIVREKIIASANLESIRLDEGVDSQSITLSGHKTETTTPKSINLTGSIYKNFTGGKYRYRIVEPNLELCAGDIVTIDGETFAADLISYYAKASKLGIEQNMEISQA